MRDVLELRTGYAGVGGVSVDAAGLEFGRKISVDHYERIGENLGHGWSAWAIGDWLVAGEALGKDAAQVVEPTGRSKDTLLEYARVARRIPRTRRRAALSFTHHQLVAAREPDEQDDLLDRAVANGWSIEEFRGVLRDDALSTRQRRTRADVEVLELVQGVARTVLNRAEPLGDGYARVPEDVLDRLANALGEPR